MRDPARIPEVMAEMERVWRKVPDMRLGQFIIGVAGVRDPYNIEEDVWMQLLKEFETRRGL